MTDISNSDKVSVLITSVLESCSHHASHAGEGLIHPLGESLVHSLPGLIIADERQTVIRLVQHLVNHRIIY